MKGTPHHVTTALRSKAPLQPDQTRLDCKCRSWDSRDTLPVRVSTCTAWRMHTFLLLCLINALVKRMHVYVCVFVIQMCVAHKQHTFCGHNACVSEACISAAQWGRFTVLTGWSVSLITDVLCASRRIQRSHITAHLRCANQQLRFCINIPTLLYWGCLWCVRWISCCWKALYEDGSNMTYGWTNTHFRIRQRISVWMDGERWGGGVGRNSPWLP